MAFGANVGLDFSFPASGTMVQFTFVTLNSSKKIATAAGAAGESVLGVVQDDATINQASEVRTGGTSKIKCGGTFAAGDLLCSDGSGQAVKYTKATVFTGTPYVVSGSLVLGIALEAGVSGQLSSMLVSPRGLSS